VNDVLVALGPIAISVAISLGGAFVISRYAGPAQQAYLLAVEKRLELVTNERNEAQSEIPHLRSRIEELEREVDDLKRLTTTKDREIADLYRRLDADERRLAADERRLP
jgi:chromosome segregation ATPase